MKRVAIINYGNGNANSIRNCLHELGVDSIYTSDYKDISEADYIILPGVGHHRAAMKSLEENGLVSGLNRAVIDQGKPVLGICLGMQLMTIHSEEGDSDGLGWIKCHTRRIDPSNTIQFKVPHVGWNSVEEEESSFLLDNLSLSSKPFYFCNAYAIDEIHPSIRNSSYTYDKNYIAHFEEGNIFATQFHPEKSQEHGLQILKRFLSYAPSL